MKPNWQDAPEWANYLAMDKNGDWHWHELKPVAGSCVWAAVDGNQSLAYVIWRYTLEQRPKDEK